MSHGGASDILLSAEEDVAQFFRSLHGRRMPALGETYPLPVDADEEKRQELHHRLIKFIFSGKNYMGPVKEALQFGEKRRILDLGTGKGYWAIDMADEFPRADVVGIDIAPIQPEYVPPNCQFEICNLDESSQLPYPEESFDLVHARSIHIGIQDYPGLVEEIGRLLKPGGLALLIEPDLFPATAADSMGDPTRGAAASSSTGTGLPQGPQPHSASGPAVAPSSPGSLPRHGNAAHGTGESSTLMGTARTAGPTGSNSAGVTAVQGLEATLRGVASISGFASPTTPSPPHSPRVQQRPNADGILRSPLTAHSCLTSLTPTRRGPTTNRRHLDFILNHGPESPRPPPAPLPQSALVDRRSAPTPANSDAQSPRAGPSTAADGPTTPPTAMPGWSKLWATFRTFLEERPRRVDVTVPSRLGDILASSGFFEDVVVKQANVPVGFWPQDPTMLTIGQLQWMDYELLIPALQPFFLSSETTAEEVTQIVQDAQHDLYYPTVPLLAHIHIAYATKRRN